MRVIPSADPRAMTFGAKLCRLAAMIVLGALLAGCDRCGDWYSPFENPFKPGSQVCRDGAGQPH